MNVLNLDKLMSGENLRWSEAYAVLESVFRSDYADRRQSTEPTALEACREFGKRYGLDSDIFKLAAYAQNYEVMDYILKKIDYDFTDWFYGHENILEYFCDDGPHGEMVRFLVDHGAGVCLDLYYGGEPTEEEGFMTLFYMICESPNEDLARYIFPYVDKEKAVTYHYLECICETGLLEEAKQLIDAGTDVNYKGKWREPPIYAACNNGHLDIVKLLLEHGANIADCSVAFPEQTTLSVALKGEHLEVVRFLIDNGAIDQLTDEQVSECLVQVFDTDQFQFVEYFNSRLEKRSTLILNRTLHRASICGWRRTFSKEKLDMLIDAGARLDSLDSNGNTLLSNALCREYPWLWQMCYEAGISVNMPNNRGETAIMRISSQSQNSMSKIRWCIEHGADVNAQDYDGKSVLMHFCSKDDFMIFQVLLETGADINAQDNEGDTALHLFLKYEYSATSWCRDEYREWVSMFHQAGADPFIKNKRGKIALRAVSGGWLVAELLKEYGLKYDDILKRKPLGW